MNFLFERQGKYNNKSMKDFAFQKYTALNVYGELINEPEIIRIISKQLPIVFEYFLDSTSSGSIKILSMLGKFNKFIFNRIDKINMNSMYRNQYFQALSRDNTRDMKGNGRNCNKNSRNGHIQENFINFEAILNFYPGEN